MYIACVGVYIMNTGKKYFMCDVHDTFVGVRANLHTFCALNADPNDQLLI